MAGVEGLLGELRRGRIPVFVGIASGVLLFLGGFEPVPLAVGAVGLAGLCVAAVWLGLNAVLDARQGGRGWLRAIGHSLKAAWLWFWRLMP